MDIMVMIIIVVMVVMVAMAVMVIRVFMVNQGCIICAILPSGMGARGFSSEHVENMEMFSCSTT